MGEEVSVSVHVGQLWHYPVKSMQGEPADEVVLGPGGVVTAGTVRVGDPVTVEPSTAPDGTLAHIMTAMKGAIESQAAG